MRKTVKIDYEELQLSFGYWRDVFQGYQTKTDMIFLSGLQYPMTVINRLYEAIREDKKKIEMDLQLNTEFVFKDDYTIQVKNTTTNSGLSAREKLMKLFYCEYFSLCFSEKAVLNANKNIKFINVNTLHIYKL